MVLVGAGGAVGALGRYATSQAFPVSPGHFPFTTFAINVTGAFALGGLLEWLVRHRSIDHWARFFVGIGVLGAFTTFSTFATETVVLARDGHAAIAVLYAAGSVAAGLVAALLGLIAAGWRVPPVPPEGES